MAITVAELQVEFDAETKQFKTDVKGLEKRLKTFEGKAQKSGNRAAKGFENFRASLQKIGPLVAGITAVLGPAFLVAGTRNALAFGDAVQQTADKVGFSVEALQELRFASDQVGITQQTLDLGLQRFSRRIAEAAQGQGEAKKTLEELNIELRDNQGLLRDSDDILNDVADALARTATDGDRLRIAFKLFDSEGAGLVNILKDGSGALQDFRDQARDLGIVIDRDAIARMSKLNSELSIADQIMSTTLKESMLELAPVVVGLFEDFGTFGQNIAFLIARFREAEGLTTNQLRARSVELSTELAELQGRANEIKAGGGLFAGIRDFLGIPAGGIGTLDRINEQIGETTEELEKLDAVLAKRTAPEVKKKTEGLSGVIPQTPDQIAAEKALLSAQQAGLSRIIGLQDQLRSERLAASEPLFADIEAISQLIADTQAQVVAEGDAAERRDQVLEELRTNRRALMDEFQEQTAAQITLEEELEAAVTAVAVADFDRAEAILKALAARQAEAVGVQDTNDAVRTAIERIKAIKPSEPDEDAGFFNLGDSVEGAVQRGAIDGLRGAFTGEGIDILATLGDIATDIFTDALSSGIEQLTDSLSDVINEFAEGLSDAVGSAGEAGGGGGQLGAALGAALGIGLAIATRELSGPEVRTQRANIQSAVNSSQQIRGVVAGPTGIAIAKVSEGISDGIVKANVPVLRELRLIVSNTSAIVRNTSSVGGAAGATDTFDATASQTLG